MHHHANAKLGLGGRHALVLDVEPATACKWWRRWREASAEER